MENIIYLTPLDGPPSQNTLIYVLAHRDRRAAEASWKAFRADPEWQKARAASEANGPVTTKTESMFLTPTAYSPTR